MLRPPPGAPPSFRPLAHLVCGLSYGFRRCVQDGSPSMFVPSWASFPPYCYMQKSRAKTTHLLESATYQSVATHPKHSGKQAELQRRDIYLSSTTPHPIEVSFWTSRQADTNTKQGTGSQHGAPGRRGAKGFFPRIHNALGGGAPPSWSPEGPGNHVSPEVAQHPGNGSNLDTNTSQTSRW